MRKLFLTVAGLVLVALVAAVVWLLTLDLERYRQQVENQLEILTGRSVAVSGGMRLTLVPDLTIALADVTVGTRGRSYLRLPEVHAVISPASLLALDLAIERIRIIEPTVSFGGSGMAGTWTGGDGREAMPLAVRIDSVEIVDATIVWYGPFGDMVVEQLDLFIEAKGADGPFELNGSFHKGDVRWSVDGALGRLSRPNVAATMTVVSRDGVSVRASGTVEDWRDDPGFTGNIGIDMPRFELLTGFGAEEGLGLLPASFDAAVNFSGESVHVNDLALQLGASSVLGNIESSAGQLAIRMASGRLDLDHLAPAFMAESGWFPGEHWLRERDIAVELTVDHALFRGEAVRQLAVAARIAGGTVAISRARAVVPGNTEFSLSGEIGLDGEVPIFRGPVDMISSDLRTTLEWFGLELDAVPRDRLRQVGLSARCEATPETVVLSEMDLTLDSSHVTGSFISRLGARPKFVTDLKIDEFVLDPYVPPAGPGLAFGAGPWDDFDLDVWSEIRTMVHGGLVANDVVVDGSLKDGLVEIRKFEAGDVSGATVEVTGRFDPAAETLSLVYDVKAADVGRLVRETGIEPPFDISPFGETELSGSIWGSLLEPGIKGTLATALADVDFDGSLSEPLGDPSFDGRIIVTGEDLASITEALGFGVPGGIGREFSVTAEFAGNRSDARFTVDAGMLGATLEGNGLVREERVESSSFALRHEDLAGLASSLGVTELAGLEGPLDVAIEAAGSPDQWTVTLKAARIGPSSLKGTLAYATPGERPRIDTRLQGDMIVLDAIAAVLAGRDPARSNGELALGFLDHVDGRIDLAAERLLIADVTLDGAVVKAAAEGGVLDLEILSGRLFGGQARVQGSIRTGVPHQADFGLTLNNADLEEILGSAAGTDSLSGRLDFDVKGRAAGLTGRDLLESLAGEGSWSVRRGTVRGFDFRAITQSLAGPGDEAAIAAQLAESTGSGTTGIVAIDGTFAIDKGVVRSSELSVIFNGAEGDFHLDADLPRWWVSLAGSVVLTGRSGLPVIAMAVNGPIGETDLVVDTRLLEDHLVKSSVPESIPIPNDKPPAETDAVLHEDDAHRELAEEVEESGPPVVEPDDTDALIPDVVEETGTPQDPGANVGSSLLSVLGGGIDETPAASQPEEEETGPSSGGLLDMLSRDDDPAASGDDASILRVFQDP